MKYKLIFSITLIWFISTKTYSQGCEPSNSYIELDANNVRAGLQNTGDMWWDDEGNAKYFFPNDSSGVSAMFTGCLWLGATDESGNLHMATPDYPWGNTADFWSGPLDADGAVTPEACLNWDRFFKVNRTTVEAHDLDYSDGNIDIRRAEIYSWPAKGNQFFEEFTGFSLPEDTELAPYYDKNENGVYEPDKGEHPAIKGDQSIWWVFNDAGNTHFSTPESLPLNVEVQVMAYAESSEIAAINNTTFYDYKIINKSQESYEELYVGLFADPDLGCYTDDYIGFDSLSHTAFVYNQDDIDGSLDNVCSGGRATYDRDIPMLGVTIQKASFDYKKKRTMSYYITTTWPSTSIMNAANKFNLLRGLHRDGRPMTYGGLGYNTFSTDTVSFIFPGDPSDPDSWSLCNIVDTTFLDPRIVMSNNVGVFKPDDIITLTYAVVAVEDVPHPCPSLDKLRAGVSLVRAYDGNLTAPIDYSNEIANIYPNPTNNHLTLILDEPLSGRVDIYNASGTLVLESSISNNKRFEIRHELLPGLYFLIATNRAGKRVLTEKIVVSR